MGHEFETDNEISVDATPEQVWEAIATGPGIDSWFMGRNEVEPREGGAVRRWSWPNMFTADGPRSPRGSRRTGSPPAATRLEDGTFMPFEYLVEGRDQGSTVVRLGPQRISRAGRLGVGVQRAAGGRPDVPAHAGHVPHATSPAASRRPIGVLARRSRTRTRSGRAAARARPGADGHRGSSQVRLTRPDRRRSRASSTPCSTRASSACAPSDALYRFVGGGGMRSASATTSSRPWSRKRPSAPGSPGSPNCSPERSIEGPTPGVAALLAQRFTVLNFDRRGKGDGGDTLPYAVEREVGVLAPVAIARWWMSSSPD